MRENTITSIQTERIHSMAGQVMANKRKKNKKKNMRIISKNVDEIIT